jgi:hypothetical protein
MGLGLRVRVVWDGTTVEDRLHDRPVVRIGAGRWAQVVAPGRFERYATVMRARGGYQLVVAPGAAVEVASSGEAPVRLGEAPLTRWLAPRSSALLHMGSATVERGP